MTQPFDELETAACPGPSQAPTQFGERLVQLVAALDEHIRPWATETAAHHLNRAGANLRSLRDAVDAVVDEHMPPAIQHRAARVTMTVAAVIAVLALVAGVTLSPHGASAAMANAAYDGAGASRGLGRFDPPPNIARRAPATVAVPSATPKATTPTTIARAVTPRVPKLRGALPVGKGMWIWLPERAEGGDVGAIVGRATSAGLTHLYVRVGSSVDGFVNQDFLARLLPAAHAAGIRVYGWDFPYLDNWQDDVNRAIAAANFTAPGGHRLDGFSADIELRSMGVNISAASAMAYGSQLRQALGPKYPLIATVPRPSSQLIDYPYAQLAANFDALAPMVYWLNREPGTDVAGALFALARYGKPVFPIGQAYDGSGEGGPPGVPSPAAIKRFMEVAEQFGATSVSFWSWQHADAPAWAAVHAAPQFTLPVAPDPLYPGQVRAYQALLTSLGFPVQLTNQVDEQTAAAVAAFQQEAHLPVTGVIDGQTRSLLLKPFSPPIQPQR